MAWEQIRIILWEILEGIISRTESVISSGLLIFQENEMLHSIAIAI